MSQLHILLLIANIYIYMYIHMYEYISTYIYIYTYPFSYVFVYWRKYINIHIRICIQIHIHICMYACIHVCICIQIHIHMYITYIYIYISMLYIHMFHIFVDYFGQSRVTWAPGDGCLHWQRSDAGPESLHHGAGGALVELPTGSPWCCVKSWALHMGKAWQKRWFYGDFMVI